jgi:hypothetical protein
LQPIPGSKYNVQGRGLFLGSLKDACSTTPGYTSSNGRTSANYYLRIMQKGLWTHFRVLSQDLPQITGGNHENSVQIAENWVKKHS